MADTEDIDLPAEDGSANKPLSKKEKEKLKRAEKKRRQKEREKAAKAGGDDAADDGGDDKTSEASENITSNADNVDDDDDNDDDNDEGGAQESAAAKKKRKKKKKDKDAKEKKKNTGMGALLKEKLRLEAAAAEEQRKREEELLRKIQEEEEEKKRAADEIARKKREKKEREKAKIQKQKEEGTYMTKKQKQKLREQKEKLMKMQESGNVTIGLSSKPKPSYSKKKKTDNSQDSTTPSTTTTSATTSEAQDSPTETEHQEPSEDGAGEKDDDGASSDSDDDWEKLDQDEDDGKDGDEGAEKQTDEMNTKAADNEAKRDVATKAPETAQKQGQEEEEEVDNGSAAKDYGGVNKGEMRSPICVVLGHVDTGKTKILDKIRKTSVQDGEAGGITQQIGASFFPVNELKKQTQRVKQAENFDWNVPGLLIMDTPGHESFSNLRDRGSSLCNIAILVVDIMHGLEPQTVESINLLKQKKVPFIVALNKVDRIIDWKPTINSPIQNSLKKQKTQTKEQFEVLYARAKLGMQENGLNCELYYENKNDREFVNIVPTSAHTGEGIPDLLFLLIKLSQRMLKKDITFTNELNCTVLEVKKIDGYGTTIDVILADGTLCEGDEIVISGFEGPIVTTVRSLLMPEPLKEMRVKNAYRHFKSVPAANGVKISGKDFEKAIPGLKVHVVKEGDDVEEIKELVIKERDQSINSLKQKLEQRGVHVQASTIGSMEALLTFLKDMKIPVSGLSIGPVTKKDVTKASVQLERDRRFALILAFDVPVEREAQQYANVLGIKIFTAQIIYHLFDNFQKHVEEEKARLRAENEAIAIFPCVLKIMPENIFNTRDPIVMGVVVEKGIVKVGSVITVDRPPEFCDLGVVESLEFDNKPVQTATVGQEVCIKIDAAGGDKRLYGRHFDHNDRLISKISRRSIDAVKTYFKEDLKKSDWVLMKKLKDKFGII